MTVSRLFARLSIFAVAAGAAALAAAQPAQPAAPGSVPPAVDRAAHAFITQAALEGPIRFLASDLLEGRGPASRGDELARLYLQTQLEGMGYQPAFANGAWQQPFDIVGIKAQFPKTWSFTGKGGPVSLAWHEDYIASSGQQKEQVSVANAELVFVGYGIQAPEYQWDDYKGASLAGKILVMMNNDPDWDPNLFAGKRRLYYGRWDYKYESAARQKARTLGILTASTAICTSCTRDGSAPNPSVPAVSEMLRASSTSRSLRPCTSCVTSRTDTLE